MSERLGHLRRLALKGPHAIAQGEALGWASKYRMSPERAKYGSVQWTNLAGRKSSQTMPPFQGWNRERVGFAGLRPGLSHSAPSGPGDGRALPKKRHPARRRGIHTHAGTKPTFGPDIALPRYGSRAFARDDDRVGERRCHSGDGRSFARDDDRLGGTNPRADAKHRTYTVIPAQAGIQCGDLCWRSDSATALPGLVHWPPAFAGVTGAVRCDAAASQPNTRHPAHPNTRHPARRRGIHTHAGTKPTFGPDIALPRYGSRAFARDDDRGGVSRTGPFDKLRAPRHSLGGRQCP